MIVGLLAVAGLGLLALPWLARPLGRRLAPSEWSRLCLLAIGAGAAAVEAAAVLLAAPTVLRALGVPALAASCQRMLGPLTPGGPAAGWAAAAVGVTIPVLGAIGVVRARRTCQAARVEPCLGEHRTLDEGELVVLPTPHVLAVSVAGPGGQVVVSEGLVNALSPAQLDLVISHEAAHLANDHHRYLTLATAVEHAFAAFPPARRSTAALRVALERWADEEATAGVPANRQILRDAVLGTVHAMLTSPVLAAFAGPEAIAERLDALAAPAPHLRLTSHAVLYAPGTFLGGSVLVAVGSWAGAARHLLAMAGRCPA